MTDFKDWVVTITAELRADGYTVVMYAGFPMVKDTPSVMGLERTKAFLHWKSPSGLPCIKNIYEEGTLITPERIA